MKLCVLCNFQYEDTEEQCAQCRGLLIAVGIDPLPGKTVQDRYQIAAALNRGGTGTIYRCLDQKQGCEYAMKVMHGHLATDEDSLKRFQKEVKAVSVLRHPSICRVHDYGILFTGQPYMIMDLLSGKSLAEILEDHGYIAFDALVPVIQQVCQALTVAHSAGVVHRDIKTDNIVVENFSNRNAHVKIVDFGIAKFVQESEDTLGKITQTGIICGSPLYMSPEQCEGLAIDQRTDLYSLGIVVYECLTGRPPFLHRDVRKILEMQVKDLPDKMKAPAGQASFPAHLDRFMRVALAKNPAERFSSAQEFWDGFSGVLQSLKLEAANNDFLPETKAEKSEVVANKAPDAAGALKHGNREGNFSLPPATPPVGSKLRNNAATLVLDPSGTSNDKKKKAVPFLSRVAGLCQHLLPPMTSLVLTLLLFAVVAFEARQENEHLRTMMKQDHKEDNASAAAALLVSQGKLGAACQVLAGKARLSKLNAGEQQSLDYLYVRLAEQQARTKHYARALKLLNQVSTAYRNDEKYKRLLQQCRKAMAK